MPLGSNAMPSVVEVVTQLGKEATLYTISTLIISALLVIAVLKVRCSYNSVLRCLEAIGSTDYFSSAPTESCFILFVVSPVPFSPGLLPCISSHPPSKATEST